MKSVLIIEGQGNFPFLKNQLIIPFIKKYPGIIMPTFVGWRVTDWPSYNMIHHFDLIVSHSLGAATALEIAKIYTEKTYITIDPRHQTNWGWTDLFYPWMQPFMAPKGARIYNFYQRGFMSGYPVTGATKEKNLSWTTHFTICGRPEVNECFETLAIE